MATGDTQLPQGQGPNATRPQGPYGGPPRQAQNGPPRQQQNGPPHQPQNMQPHHPAQPNAAQPQPQPATTGGTTAGRAAIAVGLLAGFYLLALAAVAALIGATVLLVTNMGDTGAAAIKLALVLIAAAGAVLLGLVKALKLPRFEPYGLQLTEADQPRLWGMVRDLAQRVVTRPPDEIWLVPEVNAAVTEDARMLGLRDGKRYLLIGLPLFVTMNVDQLRAVIGHELGHYSHAHTRLGEINYRGRNTIIRTIQQLQGGSIINGMVRWFFEQYAKLYFLVESAVSRKQELEADQAAAAIAGRRATQSALLELPVLTAAWNFYLGQYVTSGLDCGYAPQDVFTSFPAFLNARRGELDTMRREAPDDQTSKWDSHPAIGERVAALQTAPEHGQMHDGRPAGELLAWMDRLVPALEQATVDFGDRPRVPWAEYTARSTYTAQREVADAFYRALSRITGRSPEGLETVLQYAEHGRLGELSAQLEQANAPAQGGFGAVLRVAMLEVGAAQIQHRWDGPPRFVRADGTGLELDELFEALNGGPTGVAKVRELLAAYGVDPRRAVARETFADARTAELIAALSPAKFEKKQWDLLVTTEGFLFVPITGTFKLRQPEGRLKKLVEERKVAELATEPDNLWLPYEEIAVTELTRKIPLRATLTGHDGTVRKLAVPLDVKGLGKSDETLTEVLEQLAGRAEARQG